MKQMLDHIIQDVLPLTVRLEPVVSLTDEQFVEFCAMNEIVRIERTADGMLELRPLLVGDGGARSAEIIAGLGKWKRIDDSGVAFSNAGFILPNGAMRAPTVGWISRARLATLTPEEKKGFYPICPDFVLEMRWYTDRLSVLQEKMDEYVASGARLGWLLNPLERRAHVYRPGVTPEILDNPDSLSADPELPGFTLDLARIWEPAW